MIDVEQTIISQYGASPILNQLIQNMNAYIDPSANINSFYNMAWNVDTAEGWGLDVWGRIVGVSRVVQISQVYLGFGEAGRWNAYDFGEGIFYTPSAATTIPLTLDDSAFRLLILAKALANICVVSAPSINQILLNLFPGRGNCYVVDNLDMTFTFKFLFTLSLVELFIVQSSGALPQPAGVSFNVVTP